MAKPFLSLIIPVSNDADYLPLTLMEADRLFSEKQFSYEIIVVDDGSSDATSTIAKHFGEAMKGIKIIDNTERRGMSTVMHIGMLSAKGAWRVIIPGPIDAPLAWVCEKLSTIQPGSNARVLLLSGARTFFADILSKIHSSGLRLIFKSKMSAFYPMAACFSDETAMHIFPLLKTKQQGMLEALLIAEQLGYRPFEAKTGLRDSKYDKKTSYLQTFTETIKIRWWLWRKAYNLI